MSVSARNMKNFRINRQPIHQILVNPLIEIKKVMGGLFFEAGSPSYKYHDKYHDKYHGCNPVGVCLMFMLISLRKKND